MTEFELLRLWSRARGQIIVSQLAPTALLGLTVWLGMTGLGEASLAVRIAAAGILLASGILGALAQYSAASEGQAVAAQLAASGGTGAVAARVIASARWLAVVKFVTPAIFIVVFVALLVELFL
jgi:hypothetical protein